MHVKPSPPTPRARSRQADNHLRDWHRANKVSIYNGEAERISRFVMAYPDLETGGDLFGFWTNSGAPVVSYVIGPGIRSTHHYASFYQDVEWLHRAGTDLYDRHGLQHIGEWHSHHRLGLKQPSAGDIRTVVRGMEEKNWAKFVLMIATKDASAGSPVVQNYYLVSPSGDYKPLRPRALPGGSPFRVGPKDPREEPFRGPAEHLASLPTSPVINASMPDWFLVIEPPSTEVDATRPASATLPTAPTAARCDIM